jgi:hypothetical protein
MPKLRNMLGETGRIEIDCPGDEPLVVEYRRGAVTPRLQGKLAEIQREIAERGEDAQPGQDALLTLCELYAQTIVAWNLTDEDGATIPTDADHLADVDFGTLNLIMQEIGRQARPDPLSANGSSSGSSPAAVSEPLPITTGSS